MALAQPLIDDPQTEAAGRIIRADSLLFAADRDQTKSPFVARSEVRRALDDYDRAIELSGDPAAYAGRAVALDLLGSREAALEAQREAVRLNPASVPWRLRQAQLEGCVGQTDDWRRDAQEALGVATAIATQPAKPPSVATRYILADPPARRLREVFDRQRPADLGRDDPDPGDRHDHLGDRSIPGARGVHVRSAVGGVGRRERIVRGRAGGDRRG